MEDTSVTTKRTYKDGVFRMLMSVPENALSVYNGLNNTNYTDTAQLTYNTLENAIFMNIKNDVSFIIGLDMPLYEHQSTFTPNMPLRDLFYVADLLHAYAKDETIYSSKLITIPTPCFFVFYNGAENFPDQKILRLSEAYQHPIEHPQLELSVTMLNINPGHNVELMNRCPILAEYSIYVETTRKYSKIMPTEDAIKKAVDECIQNNILKDFLLRQKSEVIKVSIYEFDAEREWALIRRDERLLAKEELRDEVTKQVREEITRQVTEDVTRQVTEDVTRQVTEDVTKQVTEDVTRQVTEQLQEARQRIAASYKLLINLLQNQGNNKATTVQILATQCSLTEEDALNQVELYWQE